MGPDPEIGRRRRAHLTVLACAALAAYAVVAMSATAVSAALPHSHAQLGHLYLAHFLAFQLASVVSGFLSDRVGRKGFMLGGCLGLALGSLAMMRCDWLPAGVAGMFVSGLGGGMLGPPALAMTGQVHRANRSKMLSIVEAWFCIGAFAWPMAVAALLRAGCVWRTPFALAAAAPLLLAAGIAPTRFPVHHDRRRRDAVGRLALMRQPVFLLTGVAIFCYAVTEAGTQGWLPRYVQERFRAGIGVEAASVGLFWAAMGACRLVWPVLLRRLTDRQVLVGSMGLAVVLHAGAVTVAHPWSALALFAGLGLAFGAVWPLLVAGVVSDAPEMAGTATGSIVAVSGVGAMLGPFLLGQVSQAASVAVAVRLAALLTAATLFASLLIPRPKARNPSPVSNV